LLSNQRIWHYLDMRQQGKRSRKLRVTNGITDDRGNIFPTEIPQETGSAFVSPAISQYMAEIGRRGGEIGGKRRLKTMSSDQRRKIASKAARARWKNTKNK
jgi:hypothetical protein